MYHRTSVVALSVVALGVKLSLYLFEFPYLLLEPSPFLQQMFVSLYFDCFYFFLEVLNYGLFLIEC